MIRDCRHIWKMYEGLTECFEYCGECDIKKPHVSSINSVQQIINKMHDNLCQQLELERKHNR